MTEDHWTYIRAAAKKDGRTLACWIRHRLEEAARREQADDRGQWF